MSTRASTALYGTGSGRPAPTSPAPPRLRGTWRRDGLIEIEPAGQAIRLVRDGPLLVAVADGDAEPLTPEQVEEIRDALRRERVELP